MHTLLLPPIVMLFTIIIMLLFNQYIPLARFWETHACWLGIPIIILGLVIAQWHARLFKKRGTNINTFKDPGILVTDGMFRFTRNPMYLGFVVSLLGLWIVLGSATPLLALLGFFLLTHFWYIPVEERAMLRKFGTSYQSYQGKVRRWL